MADYYRDVIQLLKAAGYEFKRQGRGDHEIWWNPQTGVRVTRRSKTALAFHSERHSEAGWIAESFLT